MNLDTTHDGLDPPSPSGGVEEPVYIISKFHKIRCGAFRRKGFYAFELIIRHVFQAALISIDNDLQRLCFYGKNVFNLEIRIVDERLLIDGKELWTSLL